MTEGTAGVVPRSDSLFRSAMASFPSGVTIVTAVDETGRHWGIHGEFVLFRLG